ncbi:MAG: M4 family metallopeptidase [Chitinophagales bacterium]|nr:M4 family metallopeptidase [Sphingobacteriales bacterium]
MQTTLSYGSNTLDADDNWTAADCVYNPTAASYQPKRYLFDVHWGSMVFYDYFKTKHNRLSYDNNNADLIAWTTGSADYAAWIGTHIVIGGGLNHNPYSSLDIVAHEWAHAMNDKTSKLGIAGEAGIINESLSDIWAACTERFANNAYPIPLSLLRNMWLIGEGVTKTRPSLRSMINPNAESHPDTYNGTYWYSGADEDIRIHTNSGVMNFWFYLLCHGGSGTNDKGNSYNVAPVYIIPAEKILYRAQTKYFTSSMGLLQARQLTIQAAKDLYGICSPEVKNVIDAWYAVGVGNSLIGGNTMYVNKTVAALNSDYQYAYYLVDASNIIENNAFATYESTNHIKMSNGFHAQNGSDFNARIVLCNSTNGGMKLSQANSSFQTETQERSNSQDIRAYPNPFEKTITLDINLISEDRVYVQCINTLGLIVYESNIIASSSVIDLAHLKSGQYIVRVVRNNIPQSIKLIKL